MGEWVDGQSLRFDVAINTIPNDTKLYQKYLTFKWLKNGKDINNKFEIINNGSLTSLVINDLTRTHDGEYRIYGTFFNISTETIIGRVKVKSNNSEITAYGYPVNPSESIGL